MASSWYEYLLNKLKLTMTQLNMTAIETDGPYPGYTCASKNHEYHKDISDSIYQQSKMQSQLYLDLYNMGFYINQPDEYFFYGAHKTCKSQKTLIFIRKLCKLLALSKLGSKLIHFDL